MKIQVLITLLAFYGNAIYSMDHALFNILNNSASYDNTTQQEQQSSPGVSTILQNIESNTKPENIQNPEIYLQKLTDLQQNTGEEIYYNETDAAKFDLLIAASVLNSTNNNTNQRAVAASQPN